MKLIDLVQARKIINQHGQDRVAASLAYKMMKMMKASENDEAFYNTRLREIADRYGQKDGAGKLVFNGDGLCIELEYVEECKKAVGELDNTEIGVPTVSFSIHELDGLKLSMREVFALENLIEEG